MSLTAIVAMTSDRIIGRDGDLPWHLPEDLKFFKKTTSGHPIIMGRKTYDSIGFPLPRRRNIVLTRDPSWAAEGVEVIHTPGELETRLSPGEKAFVIGGSEIYKIFLPLLDSIIVTHVHGEYEGDTHFPEFEHIFPESRLLAETNDFTIREHIRDRKS